MSKFRMPLTLGHLVLSSLLFQAAEPTPAAAAPIAIARSSGSKNPMPDMFAAACSGYDYHSLTAARESPPYNSSRAAKHSHTYGARVHPRAYEGPLARTLAFLPLHSSRAGMYFPFRSATRFRARVSARASSHVQSSDMHLYYIRDIWSALSPDSLPKGLCACGRRGGGKKLVCSVLILRICRLARARASKLHAGVYSIRR